MRYIETTVLGQVLTGSQGSRDLAMASLEDAERGTSTYVRNEFRCTFLNDLVEAHAVISACNNLDEVPERIERHFTGKDRQWRWVFQAVLKFIEAVKSGTIVGDDLRATMAEVLEQKIEGGLMAELDGLVPQEAVSDGTGCLRGKAEPVYDAPSGTFTLATHCNAETPHDCRLAQFLRDRGTHLAGLAAYDGVDRANRNNKDYTLPKCLARALDAPDMCRGKVCWLGLADVLIAMECPDGATLYTTDHHFDTLCPALGITHERLTADE